MTRKTFSKSIVTDSDELRPVGPPLLCVQCGAIFQELECDQDRVLICAWCFGGGPFEELEYDLEARFPTITHDRLIELQRANKTDTVFHFGAGARSELLRSCRVGVGSVRSKSSCNGGPRR